jgi:hypothetical protein
LSGEIDNAVNEGVKRTLQGIHGLTRHKYGNTEPGWNLNIEGIGGEIVCCRYFGLEWNNGGPRDRNGVKAPDSKCGVEVRTVWPLHKRLIVHEDDVDERPFVLMAGQLALWKYWVQGWLFAHEVKQHREWWEDPQRTDRAAFFAPTKELRSAASFHEYLKKRDALRAARTEYGLPLAGWTA